VLPQLHNVKCEIKERLEKTISTDLRLLIQKNTVPLIKGGENYIVDKI